MATKIDSFNDLPVILRLPAVCRAAGYPTSTIYRLMAEGKFPRQVQLGPKSVGWVESEVRKWIEARIAVRDAEPNAACSLSICEPPLILGAEVEQRKGVNE